MNLKKSAAAFELAKKFMPGGVNSSSTLTATIHYIHKQVKVMGCLIGNWRLHKIRGIKF